MNQSPFREANNSSATEEIYHLLWNSTFNYRIYNSPPLVSIVSQMDPVYAPLHLSKIRFNIILPSTSGSFKWSPSLRFPH
jgi:hypothetical protein